MIKVVYRGELVPLTGKQEESIDAKKVRDVMAYLKKSYPPAVYKAAKKMLIVVNQKSITLEKNFQTELKEGDVLGFLPICGGG